MTTISDISIFATYVQSLSFYLEKVAQKRVAEDYTNCNFSDGGDRYLDRLFLQMLDLAEIKSILCCYSAFLQDNDIGGITYLYYRTSTAFPTLERSHKTFNKNPRQRFA